MYEECMNLLQAQEIEFENGLTFDEVEEIGKIYEIKFPCNLREFLMTALPTSKGFYKMGL